MSSNISDTENLYYFLRMHHNLWIQATARQISKSNRDLADDLEQEGNITLWNIAKNNLLGKVEDSCRYVHSSIRFAMCRFLRRERKQRRIPAADLIFNTPPPATNTGSPV